MSNVLALSGKTPFASSSVDEIFADLRAGCMVIIMDDEDRENEGDLIMAAERATPEAVAFMIRYTSGIICVPMEEKRGSSAWSSRKWCKLTAIPIEQHSRYLRPEGGRDYRRLVR